MGSSLLSLLAILASACGAPRTGDSAPASVVVFYRHGDRVPVDPYPLDPWRDPKFWPVPYGELTDLGKLQHYQLGKTLRSRYGHLLKEKFDPTNVRVQSTDMDRTLMSALSNLAGMFPVNESQTVIPNILWQPIPIHTIPEKIDEVLAMKAPCPKFDDEKKKLLNSAFFKKLLKDFEPTFRYVSNHTGKFINDITQASYIYDTLFIEEHYNYTLPEWTKKVYPEKLKSISEISFLLDTYNPTLARLKIGPLVKDIIEHITSVETNKNFYKMKIYSCHDTTIASLLNGLNIKSNVMPPYASSLIFEIYPAEANSEPYIKVLYQMEELNIPNCGKKCPLYQWVTNYSNLVPKNHYKECANQNSTCVENHIFEPIVYFLIVVTLFLLLTIFIMYSKYKSSGNYKC